MTAIKPTRRHPSARLGRGDPMYSGMKGSACTVMIADNEFLLRDILKSILEKSGYSVIAEAEDGLEAICKYSETRPGILFVDVIMPMKNGVDVTRDIISLDREAKVVICSTTAHRRIAETGIEAGAVDLLLKPYKIEQVREVMRKHTPSASPPGRRDGKIGAEATLPL